LSHRDISPGRVKYLWALQ